MTTIKTPALYAIRLINELNNQNISAYSLLQNAKINIDELNNKEQQIPQSKYIELVSQVVKQHNVPVLGFQVGQHTGLLEHGIISYAILSCENLWESIRRFEKYQNLIGPILMIKLTIEGDNAILSAVPAPHLKWCNPAVLTYFTQEWIASFMQWQKYINCSESLFNHIKFGFPEPNNSADYESHLNCSFEFGHHLTQISFDKRHLELSLNFANHQTNDLCIHQCDKLLREQHHYADLTTEIIQLLANTPSRIPNIKEISSALFITSRTLHRRLLKESTSFQEIIIQFRMSLAKRYLIETNLPISEISMLVGYADHSNFYRTFRKESGHTPQQFRFEINNIAA